jgi:hypothetical protein
MGLPRVQNRLVHEGHDGKDRQLDVFRVVALRARLLVRRFEALQDVVAERRRVRHRLASGAQPSAHRQDFLERQRQILPAPGDCRLRACIGLHR